MARLPPPSGSRPPTADEMSAAAQVSGCQSGRGSGRSAGQTLAEQVLALLGALATRLLGALEEVGQLGVALALGILLVGLETQHVGQALLGEPDDVVVLVLGAGDLTGLGLAGRHVLSPLIRVLTRFVTRLFGHHSTNRTSNVAA